MARAVSLFVTFSDPRLLLRKLHPRRWPQTIMNICIDWKTEPKLKNFCQLQICNSSNSILGRDIYIYINEIRGWWNTMEYLRGFRIFLEVSDDARP